MKKIAAIFLMLILLFNAGGYRLAFSILQEKASTRLESHLDNYSYDESQLVEIRVAMNMPYQERFTEFERHYGEIEIDGKAYTYVKRKIEGDIVIFKCIANESKEQLKSLQDEWAKANSDAGMNKPAPKQTHSFAKIFAPEFEQEHKFQLSEQIISGQKFQAYYYFTLPQPSVSTPHQPPESV